MKYYVIADVHGFYSIMNAALEEAGFYTDPVPHKLIMLGDLFDRGNEAKEIQDFTVSLMEKQEVILIRGNHEDLFMEMITEDEGLPYSHHVSNGTYGTALQLTGFDPVMAQIRHYEFANEASKTPYCQRIIPAMRDYYETEHYVFVHGYIPCFRDRNGSYSYYETWRESDQREWMAARWSNGMLAARTAQADKTVVCGHWHASYGHARLEKKCTEFGPDADFSPYYGSGIIALDACTAHSRKVNVLVLEDEELQSV